MKIAQITYPGFGGLGSVVFSLIDAPGERPVDWEAGFIGDLPLDPALAARCEALNIPNACFRTSPGKPYAAWRKLSQWLTARRPDAVICHSINAILACKWYGLRYRVPVIAVEHTPNQVKTRSERAASLVSMLVADKVVVLTEDYRRELRSQHGRFFRPRKVVTIPNGIDLSVFHPPSPRPERKRLRLGMAARFSFSKRQDLLIDTMKRLAELRPDLDVTLSLAGNGDRLEAVRDAAAGVGNIHFDGLLDEPGIATWMQDLDIYVHATAGETLSTSLLQAMASGLPILASDIPGVSNLLQDGVYGRCIDNEATAFATAILALADDPQSAAAMGARARVHCETHYSMTAMRRAYLGLIPAPQPSSPG
jgi:glycosyltransferase involved in cell wall biosynthesis